MDEFFEYIITTALGAALAVIILGIFVIGNGSRTHCNSLDVAYAEYIDDSEYLYDECYVKLIDSDIYIPFEEILVRGLYE